MKLIGRLGFRIALMVLMLGGIAGGRAASAASGPVPPPSECTVTARSRTELERLAVATPAAGTPPFAQAPVIWTLGQLPGGPPVDAATLQAVTATMRELSACVNANDLLRMTGLYTEHFLRGAVASQLLTSLQGQTGPSTPFPEKIWHPMPELVGVQFLADGRVGLVSIGSAGPDQMFYIILAKVGNRWLIDEEHPVDLNMTTPKPACACTPPLPTGSA